jgi:branched-chain amino acid transport system substrate-binding protein
MYSIRRNRRSARHQMPLIGIALMVVSLIAAACGSSGSGGGSATSSGGTTGTIKLGVLADLSGACSGTGPPIVDGAKVAAQQLNAGSGVLIGGKHYKVQLVTADTQSSNVPAVAAAQQLITSDGVNVILGPTCSGPSTNGVAPIAKKYNVIYIDNFPVPGLESPTTAVATAQQYPSVFLDSPRIAASAAGYAEGIPVYFPSAKRVYILDDPNSTSLLPYFTSYLESKGITVQSEIYPFNTTDFTPYLTRVEAFKPDVLMYGATEVESLAILKQSLALDAAPAYYTVNGSCCQDPISNAVGHAISQPWAGLAFPDSFTNPTSAKATSLKSAVQTLAGSLNPESSFSVVGYDQVNLAIQAMQQGGGTSVADVEKGFSSGTFDLIEGGSGVKYDAGNAPTKSSQDICYVTGGVASCKNLVFPPAGFTASNLSG